MIIIGMIYQYDDAQGSGLIMLSNGETNEFSSREWVDSSSEPKVGQKVAYEESANRILIRVASEDDQAKAASEEVEESKENDSSTDQYSVDEYIDYFTKMGFKLVKNVGDASLQTVTLRKYTEVEFSEIIIERNGSKIDVTQMVDGKKVTTD